MKHSKTVLAVVFLMAFATAGEAALKFACNSGGRAFRLTPGSSPLNVVSMWNKSASDVDIEIILDLTGGTVGVGEGVINRFETVTSGVLPGLEYIVAIRKVSGPNTPCLLHIGEQAPFGASAGTRVQDLGSLRSLAERDERFAGVLERMSERAAIKRGARR